MKQRTEEEWRTIHENAMLSILAGRTANDYWGEMSITSIVSDALQGADHLVKEMKKREEKEIQSLPVP